MSYCLIEGGCGCPGPVLNPCDFGQARRLPGPCSGPARPEDPGGVFPRALSAAAGGRQSTSLCCEPWASCGCPAGCACGAGRRRAEPAASYANEGLDRAAGEIARVLTEMRPEIPGMWSGPAALNFPSGNLALQIALPAGGPLDPVPVFTYNSLACGFARLFCSTVQPLPDGAADIIDGCGRCLVYEDPDGQGRYRGPGAARNALRQLPAGGWVETQPDGLQWRYASSGLLERLQSPAGARWTITRNADQTPDRILGPHGRQLQFGYNAQGRLASCTDGAGRATQFEADELIHAVTYPDGARIELQYAARPQPPQGSPPPLLDNGALLSRHTDAEKNVTSFSYDTCGRIRELVTGEGHAYRYAYLADENSYPEPAYCLQAVDPAGAVTTAAYNRHGQITSVTDPLGQRTTYLWEPEPGGRVLGRVDANGQRVTLSYTTLANRTRALASIERPEAGTLQLTYDSDSRCRSLRDYDGRITTISWDADGQRASVLDAEGGRFTWLYGAWGLIRCEIDPLGRRTTTLYDAYGNAQAQIDPLGLRTTLAYDEAGQPKRVENPLHEITTYARDELGRIVAVTDPLGRRTTTAYDGNGAVRRTVNAEGEIATFLYNGELRLASTTTPENQSSARRYDSRGNLTAEVNPLDERTTHHYDAASRRTATVDPLGRAVTLLYDAAGNQTGRINAELERSTTVYDGNNRAVAAVDPLGRRTTTAYDAAGLTRRTTNPENETTTSLYLCPCQLEDVDFRDSRRGAWKRGDAAAGVLAA